MPRSRLRHAVARSPALLLAFAACAPPSLRTSFRNGKDLVQTAVDARELDAVRIGAGVSDVEILAGPGDSVRVHVTLRSGDARRLERDCLPNASLETRREGRTVAFHVEQRTRDQCGAVWRVAMPAHLDVTARVSVGKIRITGLAGAIDAETQTGDIVVLSRAPSHGEVKVRADVGGVKARVRGYDVPPPRKYGAGASLILRGSGGPRIDLRAGVGEASLDIGEP